MTAKDRLKKFAEMVSSLNEPTPTEPPVPEPEVTEETTEEKEDGTTIEEEAAAVEDSPTDD